MSLTDVFASRCPNIRLCSTEPGRLDDVREMLEVANYDTTFAPLTLDAIESESFADLDLVVVEGPTQSEKLLLDFCRTFRERMHKQFIPLVTVTDDPGPVLRAFLGRIGADGHIVRPVDPVGLLSQVQSLLRIKFLQDRIVEQSRELNETNLRLRAASEQIDRELELARRVQQSMLPHVLPDRPPVRFAVRFEVSSQVSGDFYDVIEVDDDTTAFYVADAMGHGVPAGLITIFVKKGIQPVILDGRNKCLRSPAQVLTDLNRDLLSQELSDSPFITMAYFVLHRSTKTLQFARGGHPYPLLIPANGAITELRAEGSLLGVFETDFTTESHRLQSGDKVLIYTDGIDLVEFSDQAPGLPSFLASIEHRRALPIEQMVDAIYHDLFPDGRHADDFTLLGVEIEVDVPTTHSSERS